MAVHGLIAGLGNPGSKYDGTRHNLGFMLVDALLRSARDVTPLAGGKFSAELWQARFEPGGDVWLLAKPQTFMNLSGASVQPLLAWHRLPPERLLVLHDELDLPPGRMKFKKGGGNAGHNGLQSITERLGSPDFYRLRLGIGRSPYPGGDTINWVLGRLSPEEKARFEALTPTGCEVVRRFAAGDPAAATRLANGYAEAAPCAG